MQRPLRVCEECLVSAICDSMQVMHVFFSLSLFSIPVFLSFFFYFFLLAHGLERDIWLLGSWVG